MQLTYLLWRKFQIKYGFSTKNQHQAVTIFSLPSMVQRLGRVITVIGFSVLTPGQDDYEIMNHQKLDRDVLETDRNGRVTRVILSQLEFLLFLLIFYYFCLSYFFLQFLEY